jgi:hypothetical protein
MGLIQANGTSSTLLYGFWNAAERRAPNVGPQRSAQWHHLTLRPAPHAPTFLRPRSGTPSPRPQRARAVDQQQQQPAPAAAPVAGPGSELVPDSEFNISKISFGSILTPLGVSLLAYGFGAYFMLLPGSDVSSIMLIYGFPISVLGFALSYAQLAPVPCK